MRIRPTERSLAAAEGVWCCIWLRRRLWDAGGPAAAPAHGDAGLLGQHRVRAAQPLGARGRLGLRAGAAAGAALCLITGSGSRQPSAQPVHVARITCGADRLATESGVSPVGPCLWC